MHFSKIKVLIIFFLACVILQHQCVTIEIQPDELEQIGEILIQAYMQHPTTSIVTQRRGTALISMAKTATRGLLQLLGILFTLVGANILTSKLEHQINLTPNHQIVKQDDVKVNIDETMQTAPLKQCNQNDYGCDDNLCWRTCDTSNGNSTCYTSPNSKEKIIHRCIFSKECSPCWECMTLCESFP